MSRDSLSNDGDDHPLIETDMQLCSQHGDGGTPSVDHRQITRGAQNLIASLGDGMDLGPRFAAPYGTKINVWRTRGTLTISFPRATPLGATLFLVIFCLFWYGFLVMWCVIAIASREYGMALFSVLHWIAGLMPLCALANSFARTHVHINEKAYSISHRIGSGKFWKFEKRGTFEHLYQAEVTRSKRDNESSILSYGIILHEGAICHRVDGPMCELEAQWLGAEINSLLAELKGQPSLPRDSNSRSLLPPPQNALAIEQGTAMGVPVEAPIPYGVPATMAPGGSCVRRRGVSSADSG